MVKIAKDQDQLTAAITYSVYMLRMKLLSHGTSKKIVDLQTKVILPPNMSARIWLFALFEKSRVCIQNNDIVDFGRWLKMELLNQKFLRKEIG